MKKIALRIALAGVALAGLSSPAQTFTWVGNAGNNNTGNNPNWLSGTSPGANATGHFVFDADNLTGESRTTANISQNSYTMSSLFFDGNETYSGFTLSLGSFTAPTLNGNVTVEDGIHTISSAMTLNIASTFDIQSGRLTQSGAISGTGSIIKTGAGELLINSAQSFSGGVTLNAGWLRTGNNSALGSGTLTLNAGKLSSGTNARTLDNNYVLGGNLTLGDVQYKGAITFSSTGTLANNIVLTLESDATLAGAVGDGGNGYSLSKTGTGVLTLAGNNSFTGGFTLNGGRLRVGHNSAFGSGALVLNGGSVSGDDASTPRTVANNVTLGGNVTLGHATDSAPLTFSGSVTLTGNRTLTAASNVTISGAIGGAFGLTKTGAGTLTLTADNTYSGATTINGGNLVLSGANGAIWDTSAITLRNGGTLTLLNTAAANNGNRINSAATAISSFGGTIDFQHDGGAANYSEALGTVNLSANRTVIRTSRADEGQTSQLTINNLARSVGGGSVLFDGLGFGVDTRNQVIVAAALSTANVNGIVPWALIKDGSTYNLAVGGGASAPVTKFTAYDTNTSNPTWGVTVNARPGATVTGINANKSLNSLILDNGVNLSAGSLPADQTITLGTTTVGAQAGLVVQTGGSSVIDFNGDFEFILAFGAQEAIFNIVEGGTLTILRANGRGLTGTGGLTKIGGGTLSLGSEDRNDFRPSMSGALRLNEGLVDVFVGHNQALNTFAGGIEFNGGNLELNNNTDRNFAVPVIVNTDGTFTFDRRAANQGAGAIVTFGDMAVNNNPVFTLAIGANITSGTAGMTVGAVTLNSPVTFALNGTAVATSRLTVGAITDNGHTITLRGAGSFAQTGAWTGTGGLTLDAGFTGFAVLSQANTYSGATRVLGGALVLGNPGALPSSANDKFIVGPGAATVFRVGGAGEFEAAGIATFAALGTDNGGFMDGSFLGFDTTSGNFTYSNAIVDPNNGENILGVAKSSGNTLTLSGANAYSGLTVIQGGALRAAHASALGSIDAGTVVSDGAALELSGGIVFAAEPLTIVGTGISDGGALSNFSGNNTFAGPITLTAAATIGSLGGKLTITGTIARDTGNRGLTLRGAGEIEIAMIGLLGTGNVMKADTGTVSLLGENIFTSMVQINGGTLVANTIRNVGTASSLGTGTDSNLVVPGLVRMGLNENIGTLRYIGEATSSDRMIQVGSGAQAGHVGGATVVNDGTGEIVFTAGQFNTPHTGATAARTLTLSGSNTGDNTIQGTIIDNVAGVAAVGLAKTGAGKWILTAVSTYTGGTTVEAGTLVVGGTYGTGNSGLGTGTVAVNGGTLLVNARHEGGLITVASGGAIGGGGTVTGNLTLQSGALWAFDPALTLTVGGTVSIDSTFGVASLTGVNWGALNLDTPYTLIANGGDFSHIQNWGEGSAVEVGGGRSAYFKDGSLQLVVIPEPASLGTLGLLALAALLRRRLRR